ncbi:MAG TPA: recombinase family protein [Solirubrobacter sp.]|nr:recombinase family protein [Solirubrobacter sp.]
MPAASQPQRMILYVRVSTEEQAEHGYGLDAQEDILRRAAEYQGWDVVELVRDEGQSAKTLERPGLMRALQRIAAREADGLAVAKLDRLTRSVPDFADLLDWFAAADATFVALDLNVDTSTPTGKMLAQIVVAIAEWERETIAQRTRDGMAAKRAQGEPIGRPSVADQPELVELIHRLKHDEGLSLAGVCKALEQRGIPTPRGGAQWRPSSLQTILGYTRPAQRRRRAGLPDIPRRARR